MINQLTFTRFIAAFMIVFLHFGGKLFRFFLKQSEGINILKSL